MATRSGNGRDWILRIGTALVIAAAIALWEYLGGHASAEDLDSIKKQHVNDVVTLTTTQRQLASTIHAVDSKLLSIAVVLDRIDKSAGGPGMPESSLVAEPVE